MTLKHINRFVTLVGACLALASSASAQFTPPTTPASCSDTRNATAYKAGKTAGDARVTQVWKSAAINQNPDILGDKLPELVDALEQTMVSLANGQAVTQYVRCRAQGYVDAYFYRLNILLGQCVLDGADWAQFAADLYCDLSLELGGLSDVSLLIRAPAGLCGNLFEVSCEDVYQYVSKEGDYSIQPLVASYLEVTGATPTIHPECKPYTEGVFQNAFTASLHNDCSYAVED